MMTTSTVMAVSGVANATFGLASLDKSLNAAVVENGRAGDHSRADCPVDVFEAYTAIQDRAGRIASGDSPKRTRTIGVIEETRVRYYCILAAISGESYCFTPEQCQQAWEALEIINPELCDAFAAAMQPMIDLNNADSPSGQCN